VGEATSAEDVRWSHGVQIRAVGAQCDLGCWHCPVANTSSMEVHPRLVVGYGKPYSCRIRNFCRKHAGVDAAGPTRNLRLLSLLVALVAFELWRFQSAKSFDRPERTVPKLTIPTQKRGFSPQDSWALTSGDDPIREWDQDIIGLRQSSKFLRSIFSYTERRLLNWMVNWAMERVLF
jgi:hypothetical protein